QVREHATDLRPQEYVSLVFRRTVCMNLDELPLRATTYRRSEFDPAVHARCGRGLAGADIRVLDPRQDAELARWPIESQDALYQHEISGGPAAHRHRLACVMGFRSQRIVSRIIDGIDGRGLGIARGTGKGEIGIAAAPLENNQLIVDAAPPAIRAA